MKTNFETKFKSLYPNAHKLIFRGKSSEPQIYLLTNPLKATKLGAVLQSQGIVEVQPL